MIIATEADLEVALQEAERLKAQLDAIATDRRFSVERINKSVEDFAEPRLKRLMELLKAICTFVDEGERDATEG